jgi:repressor LexA
MPRTADWNARVETLRAFCRREGRVPSYREMLGLFGFRSTHAAFGLVRRLLAQGYLRRGPGAKLAPTGKLTGAIRLLGAVTAGFPSPAEEELVDILSLDDFLVRRPESTYLLTVNGDSMIEAGIQPGDLVLVERGRTPRPNDIVVAQVDDEWTIKYFARDADGVRLDPANRRYKPIRPRRALVIGGVVRAVVRKYE